MKKLIIEILSILGIIHGCRESEKALIAEILADRKGSLIIDTRSSKEYSRAHVKGAINIPHYAIGNEISKYAKSKDQKIMLYCLSGARAAAANRKLKSLGYTKTVNVGGYSKAKRILA